MLPPVLLAVSATTDNQRGPRFMEQALAALHQTNAVRRPMVFVYGAGQSTVGLFCRFPAAFRAAVLTQLSAAYPDCRLNLVDEASLDAPAGAPSWYADLRLVPDIYAIRRYPQFEDVLLRTTADPLSGILAAVSAKLSHGLQPSIAIHARPATVRQRRRMAKALATLGRPILTRHPSLAAFYARATMRARTRPLAMILRLATRFDRMGAKPIGTTGRLHDREEPLEGARDKLERHLFSVRIRINVAGMDLTEQAAASAIAELAGAFGQFTVPGRSNFRLSGIRRCHPRHDRYLKGGQFLLSEEELATLFHPATETVRTECLESNTWRQAEPPPVLPSGKMKGEAVLGRVRYRSRRETFGMHLDDRRRHLAVIGKTGMGKSTLLLNLVASDIAAGHGTGLIDPHGDLADAILELVPPQRSNEVVVLDAGDRDFPVAFNPLHCTDPAARPLIASGIVSAFKKLYGDSWGPRLEHILRNSLLALVAVPGTSLLSLLRLLSDERYRAAILRKVDDPVVRAFWIDEFGNWNDRYRTEALAPIQNKVGQFLSNPILRAITGQARSTIDLRRVMDEGRVLIANLSKGRTGEDASGLLGALLVTGIQQAAMGRADVAEADRRDFFLYVDEFQNFATESFATILSEARKYRLSLTIANQYLAQMDDATRNAVFGNVGSLVSFQVGPDDAETIGAQLAGDLTAADLVALPRFTAYARLLVEGMPSRAFSMETLPPPKPPRGPARAAKVRSASRHRYGRNVAQVQTEIAAAMAG